MPEPPPPVPPNLKLSRDQRRRLFALEPPRISGEGKCPVKPGDVVELSTRVSLRVLAVRRTKSGGWTLHYELSDRRDPVRNLRRVPSVHVDEFNFDEFGYPREPTADVLRDAAEDSAYTSAPTSLSDAGEAVDAIAQKAFGTEASSKKAQQAMVSQFRRERYELEQRLGRVREDAKLRGVDISSPVRVIERQIARLERRVYEGKDEAA